MSEEISTEKVIDIKSFADFVRSLGVEFDADKVALENNTLSCFSVALEAYANDLHGYYHNIYPEINADVPTWRAFADILEGASIYE